MFAMGQTNYKKKPLSRQGNLIINFSVTLSILSMHEHWKMTASSQEEDNLARCIGSLRCVCTGYLCLILLNCVSHREICWQIGKLNHVKQIVSLPKAI